MIVVTGAAGFIGSCIVAELNKRGLKDLILVDHVQSPGGEKRYTLKKENLKGKQYRDYFEKEDFLKKVVSGGMPNTVEAIIHMGACSSTTLQDEAYFNQNNLEYTRQLALWALKHNVRFIYASSAATYGDGALGYRDDEDTIRRCQPLNLYGESKQKFDMWALQENLLDKMVGLKFFNVFGPNEYHKDDMRSVVAKTYQKVVEEGQISLFRSYHKDYKDGEQKRDFIYVKDAVAVVMYFLDNPHVNGIFNVGTGESRTWNDLAAALFKAVGKPLKINYMDMPESLRPRYQYYTQADMSKLKRSGYSKEFTSLENAVKDYVSYLAQNSHL